MKTSPKAQIKENEVNMNQIKNLVGCGKLDEVIFSDESWIYFIQDNTGQYLSGWFQKKYRKVTAWNKYVYFPSHP